MIVADISPFKGSTVCIELTGRAQEENRRIYIHRDIANSAGAAKGMELTEEDAERLVFQNDLRRARERALYLVESREYSYSQLFDKLEENYPEEICFAVCDRLKELGLLDDRRFAEKLCRKLFETKKYGRYRVKQEMRIKGLSSALVEEVISDYEEEDEDAFERLEKLVEQKYERYLTDRRGVEKVKGALARMGYSYREIKDVLDLYDLDFDE